jgi:hypothetical protein
VARNLTDAEGGALLGQRYLLRDRDTKFGAGFRSILRDGDVEPLRLPPSSPDLNAFAKRWVRSVKQGMPVQADSVRRGFAWTRVERVPGAFSYPAFVSIALNADNVWESAPLLCPRRVNIFTQRPKQTAEMGQNQFPNAPVAGAGRCGLPKLIVYDRLEYSHISNRLNSSQSDFDALRGHG